MSASNYACEQEDEKMTTDADGCNHKDSQKNTSSNILTNKWNTEVNSDSSDSTEALNNFNNKQVIYKKMKCHSPVHSQKLDQQMLFEYVMPVNQIILIINISFTLVEQIINSLYQILKR